MGHTASSALFEESSANKMNNTRTDASTTFPTSSPMTDPSPRQAELAWDQLLQASLADRRSVKFAPIRVTGTARREGCGPNATVLQTSASGSSTTASLPNEFGRRSSFEQSKPDSLTEPTKIPMKATIVERLRTGGEALSEPPLESPLESPSVVKGCESPDDFGQGAESLQQLNQKSASRSDDFGRRSSEQSSEIEKPILHDTVVKSVIEKFKERSDLGMQKYGTTLDRTDLTSEEWANHMQEELMDAILYLERLKREFKHLQHRISDDST